jgi:hypothetical protein
MSTAIAIGLTKIPIEPLVVYPLISGKVQLATVKDPIA